MNDEPPPLGITSDAWTATSLAVRQFIALLLNVLAQQQQHIALQQQQIAQLLARVADLQARLNQHSQNSSKPPSSDPSSAPPRPARVPRGRIPGGQVGHPRHERPTPEPEQITTTTEHYPNTCTPCGADVTEYRQDACAIQTQYVWDIPEVQPLISAHHYHTIYCHCCGALVTACRPPQVPPGGFGPRTAALVGLLHGRYRISHREVVALLADLFHFPISLGSVVSCQTTVSSALAPIYAAVQTQVPTAPVANVDETGWTAAGKRRWLWVMVTSLATFFSVATSRNGAALRQLLGTSYPGIVGSDRHRPYLALPSERHQRCWSHLVRNFQALLDQGGRPGVWGADFLALSELLFRLWHLFRDGMIDRAVLQAAMVPLQQAIHVLLIQGARRCDAPEALCQELLAHEAALWTFVREVGVEPTNNAAEQALRPAVLWRKGRFGAHSTEGNAFVERMLTVSATCTQQHRHLLTFLTAAVDAFWRGHPAPKLV
jgi:transposase